MIDLAHEAAFSLGGLTLTPATREAAAGEQRAVLEPRVMQVLVRLARAQGKVVSRDDLVRDCWDGRAVGEDAINRAVAKARRLGAEAEAFSIETIPRVGYRLAVAAAEPAPRAIAEAAGAAAEPILVVLPFENLSADVEMGFLSDGVADEIILTLMRQSPLKVIGRASAFQFRGERKGEAARVLSASHVLDGAVRRGAARLRISVQLTEATSAHLLWSESYDRPVSDMLDLQEDIAAQVAHALNMAITQPNARRVVDAAAYDLFLRARRIWLSLSDEDETAAAQLLEEAVAAAPHFANAWAALASVRAFLLPRSRDHIGEPLHRSAQEAVERALEIDPDCPEALAAMSLLKPAFSDYGEKLYLVDKAIEWAPNNPALHIARAAWLYCVGRVRDALAALTTPLRLDPLGPGVETLRASLLMTLGRTDEALSASALAHARWRDSPMAWYINWTCLLRTGRLNEAEALLKRRPRRGVSADDIDIMSGWLALLRKPRQAQRAACAARIEALSRSHGPAPLSVCDFAANLGLGDEAFDLLDRALDAGRPLAADEHEGFGMARAQSALQLFVGPASTGLRMHPRFPRLCARLGLAAYWRASGCWPDCAADLAPTFDFKAACLDALSTLPAR